MAGIVSYGFYLPKYRIKTKDIADVWGKDGTNIELSLKISEKTIASNDEDSLTMGFESAQMAIKKCNIDRNLIDSVFFGSETPPYAVNPTSTIIADLLGIENDYLAYDTQFACKAATGAVISALALVESKKSRFSLAIGSDKANSKPNDALEYTAGSGSVSLLLGSKDVAVKILDTHSFSSDTPDFWRRSGNNYPSHAGRFTGEPSYFEHIYLASSELIEKNGLNPSDFQYAVFHMPNAKFPQKIAKKLGFTFNQIKDSLVVQYLGNSYSASALMGLMPVFEKAKAGDKIFLCSYGSGAGSDAFILETTKELEKVKISFSELVNNPQYVDYIKYRQFSENL